MTPTQLSKRTLEKDGYLVEITERWNAFARKRKDLFDFIDLIAVRKGEVVGVQTTSISNISARKKKIIEHINYDAVKDSGIKIVVHGVYKEKNRWKIKEVWL